MVCPTNPAASDDRVELLPCPFCGGEATVRTYPTESLWSHNEVTYTSVGCEECDYQRATEPGYTPEAIVWWNTRLAQPQSSDVGAVREACARIADSENEAAKIALREPCTDLVERAYRRGRGEAGVAIGVGIRNMALPTPTTDAPQSGDVGAESERRLAEISGCIQRGGDFWTIADWDDVRDYVYNAAKARSTPTPDAARRAALEEAENALWVREAALKVRMAELEEWDQALSAKAAWHPPVDMPKDGTILELAVDYTEGHGPLRDAIVAPTIGWNDFANTGDDKWHIVGWDWCHDHIRDGNGKILAWRPSRLNACGDALGNLPALAAGETA